MNDDIIIESFNDITLLRQDINENENKIRDLNHRLEILLEVPELKLNDINIEITSIHTVLDNITSSHKAQNDCPKISSNQDTDKIKFLREVLKNKVTINILLENVFSNNKIFLLMKSWKIIIKKKVQGNRFETPKRYSLKNGDKSQDSQINITQNRYEVLSDSDENYTKRCNKDDDGLSNNITTSISSR